MDIIKAVLRCPYGGLAVCSTHCGQRKAHARLPHARRASSVRPPWQSSPCVKQVYNYTSFCYGSSAAALRASRGYLSSALVLVKNRKPPQGATASLW